MLTYHDDRLPALAGIAAVFQKRSGDTYVSGLWKSKIAAGLCWAALLVDFPVKVDHVSRSIAIATTQSYDLGATKVPRYRVPSWTWAKLNRTIMYLVEPEKLPRPSSRS